MQMLYRLETCTVMGTTVILRKIHGNRSEICGNTPVMRMTIAAVTAEIVASTPIIHL